MNLEEGKLGLFNNEKDAMGFKIICRSKEGKEENFGINATTYLEGPLSADDGEDHYIIGIMIPLYETTDHNIIGIIHELTQHIVYEKVKAYAENLASKNQTPFIDLTNTRNG